MVKLNANENPYPPSPYVCDALQLGTDRVRLYPDAIARNLCATAAKVWGIQPENVIAGNGSDDILTMIMRTFLDSGDTIAVVSPSYTLYEILAAMQGARTTEYPLTNSWELPEELFSAFAKCIFLPNPNAQTGTLFQEEAIRRLCEETESIIIIDEAYADFAGVSAIPLLQEYPQLIVTRTLSKSYSCAGIRCGFGIASAEIIASLMKVKDSYNVNAMTQSAGIAALNDTAYTQRNIEAICATRKWFADTLISDGWDVVPSRANFILAAPPTSFGNAETIYGYLKENGWLVRHFATPALKRYLRFSIGTDEQMKELHSVLNLCVNVTAHTGAA